MIVTLGVFFSIFTSVLCFFDFFNQGAHRASPPPEGRVDSAEAHESVILGLPCDKYLCQDTGMCVEKPSSCPCPYPSSQLRCELPGDRYICISKPLGKEASNYNDSKTNFKVDAKDDTVRDCGWVSRAWSGNIIT